MAFKWVGTLWAGGLEFLGTVLMPRWEAGVQSLAGYRAMSGAESWWVQGLGGGGVVYGAELCEVQNFGGHNCGCPGMEIRILDSAWGPFLGLGAPSPCGALQEAHH